MKDIYTFIKSFFWVEIGAIVSLNICGLILTLIEYGNRNGDTFYTYQIQFLDAIPSWFFFTLLLVFFNGYWMFRLANLEGHFDTPRGSGWGKWGATLPINPLKLLSINLILIPSILVCFILVRAMNL